MLCAEMFAYCPGRNDDKCQHKRIAGHEEYEKKIYTCFFHLDFQNFKSTNYSIIALGSSKLRDLKKKKE